MIIIGVMIVLMGISIFLLNRKKYKMIEDKVIWNPGKEMKSRAIPKISHEVCEFAYNKGKRVKAPENHFMVQIGLVEAEKKDKKDLEDSDGSHSGSSFNSSDEDELDY